MDIITHQMHRKLKLSLVDSLNCLKRDSSRKASKKDFMKQIHILEISRLRQVCPLRST